MQQPYRYDSYKQIEWAIQNHAMFIHHIGRNKNRRHYSAIENGHYRVYTQVNDGKILLLDIKGDKLLHVDKTFYDETGRVDKMTPILRLQKIIWKYYS